MEALLVKIFATALALSQVTTTPDAVKTQFDRTGDQQEVARLLSAGCTHMRKAFDIEDINLDELIATAMDDPQAMTSENKVFRGISFADLQTAYRQFCKNEKVPTPAVDLGEVIDHYNKAVADLPDHNKLKGIKLPGASVVLDRKGERFAEVFEENQRRQWVPLAEIPEKCPEGIPRGRGQALLSAQRHRRARPDPRLHWQSRPVRAPAGRLHHHPADRSWSARTSPMTARSAR
jgi:penicillin-binding protein 1A